MAFVEEFIKQQHAQAHEAGMQAMDQAHERALAQQQADAEAMSQRATKPTRWAWRKCNSPKGASKWNLMRRPSERPRTSVATARRNTAFHKRDTYRG